jgi:hypothetical protein
MHRHAGREALSSAAAMEAESPCRFGSARVLRYVANREPAASPEDRSLPRAPSECETRRWRHRCQQEQSDDPSREQRSCPNRVARLPTQSREPSRLARHLGSLSVK